MFLEQYNCLKLLDTFVVQIDKELASGEYFLKESQKKRKRVEEIKVHLLQPVKKCLTSDLDFSPFCPAVLVLHTCYC